MNLSTEITREDFYEFNRYHFMKTKLKNTIFLGLITIVVLQIVLNFNEFDLIPTIVSTITMFLIYPWLVMRSIKKTSNMPDKNGSILGRKNYEFGEEQIKYKTDRSEGQIAWKSITKLGIGRKAYYLYIDSMMALVFPRSA